MEETSQDPQMSEAESEAKLNANNSNFSMKISAGREDHMDFDAAMKLLAIGTDLTNSGLALNSPEPLSTMMISPFIGTPLSKENAEFYLPACYYMNQSALKMSYLQKFTVETLFYIFYTIVCDSLQGFVALKLIGRGWYYYCPSQKWLIPRKPIAPGDTVSIAQIEEWIYFDPNAWAKKDYQGKLNPDHFLKLENLAGYLGEKNFLSTLDGNCMGASETAIPTLSSDELTFNQGSHPEFQSTQFKSN